MEEKNYELNDFGWFDSCLTESSYVRKCFVKNKEHGKLTRCVREKKQQ